MRFELGSVSYNDSDWILTSCQPYGVTSICGRVLFSNEFCLIWEHRVIWAVEFCLIWEHRVIWAVEFCLIWEHPVIWAVEFCLIWEHPVIWAVEFCLKERPRPDKNGIKTTFTLIVQELCESRGGRPGLSVLTSLTVSVDVKQHWTRLRHWSQLVPNMSTDFPGH